MGCRPRKMWLGRNRVFRAKGGGNLARPYFIRRQRLARTTAFYDAAMMALGYARVFTGPGSVGYGLPGTENDRLRLFLKPHPVTPPGPGFHLAFLAPNRDAVDRFHEAALQFGVDEGTPGLRPHYGPDYYAAFVLDPDGYKLEAKHPPPEL
jgi:catechol 2,3-dioxygenase-like lactoylglutathione lyase family enzyme